MRILILRSQTQNPSHFRHSKEEKHENMEIGIRNFIDDFICIGCFSVLRSRDGKRLRG